MQWFTNLCSVLNDMEPICVLNHVFVLREAYGTFSVAELFTDKFLYCDLSFLPSGDSSRLIRFPLYYHMHFAFLVWLQLPSVDVSLVNGALNLFDPHCV
ncbi:hypothetical protein OROGR_022951 [Orobanche gracilis]